MVRHRRSYYQTSYFALNWTFRLFPGFRSFQKRMGHSRKGDCAGLKARMDCSQGIPEGKDHRCGREENRQAYSRGKLQYARVPIPPASLGHGEPGQPEDTRGDAARMFGDQRHPGWHRSRPHLKRVSRFS
jgi:hypothetical protein